MLIQTSYFLTEPKEVQRTWKERLFSLPWRPLQKVKVIQVPSRQIYKVGNVFICHPELAEEIKRKINAETFCDSTTSVRKWQVDSVA